MLTTIGVLLAAACVFNILFSKGTVLFSRR